MGNAATPASVSRSVPFEMPPIAVDAYALVSPFGSADQTFEALLDQRWAFTCLEEGAPIRNCLAAVIPRDLGDTRDPGSWQRFLGISAMRDAIGDRLDELRERQTRVSFIFSTSFGHLLDASREEAMSTWAKDCLFDLGFDANPIVVGSGCSSSADGIAVAAAMLVDGAADVAVVVAVDIVTRTKRVAHSKLGTMTDELPRPFDLQRNGMLLGEAATAIILRRSCPGETSEGELVGIGSSNDAYSLTAPDPTGFAGRLAIERALGSAKLISQDIGVYYAHGTGTVLNDALEASIIADLFADNPSLVVVGTKGALGHSLGACGALEFVLLLRMLKDQKVPATVGTARAMETISNRLGQISPEKRELRYGLTMTLGFGGFNTALIARAMPCPSGNAPEAVGPGRAK